MQAQGRLSEAEAELRAALSAQIDLLGPHHLHVAFTRSALADVLRAQGRHTGAELEHRTALDDATRAVGPTSPQLATLQLAYARALLEAHKPRLALTELEQAASAWRDDPRVPESVRTELASLLARASEQAPLEHESALPSESDVHVAVSATVHTPRSAKPAASADAEPGVP